MSERADAESVSVVIPAYERAALVERAVRSSAAQSPPPREILVVDDGSRDGTAERVEALAGELPVRCIVQERRGAAAARNRGVREAQSLWIAFLDSDDLWLPGHLERMRAAIAATAGAALFYFADTELSEGEGGGRLWERSGVGLEGSHELLHDPLPWALRPLQPMMLQSSVFHREGYLRLGGLEERLVRRHDTHLFFKLALAGPACAVAGVGARMTSDDVSAARLTVAHGGGSRVYWECTAWLYADLLRRARRAPAPARAELRRRLELGHWRLARLAASEGRLGASLRQLLRALRVAPSALVRRALRAVAGRRRGSRAPRS